MKNFNKIAIALVFFHSVNGLTVSAQEPGDYFKITVVDEQTGRGVPLVELMTTNDIRYYTDNNGIIAFYEPGLMDQEVYFYIKSHGYEYPADYLGYRGKTIKTTKGGSTLIKIKRDNIAERLYRITGQGLYHHSLLLGQPVPIYYPVLNGQVMGQDAAFAIPYNGKLYWFWGDTDRPSYPLGNFAAPGATSEWPDKGGLDPGIGINLNYFVNESGFCKPMFPSTKFPGPGPRWISCPMTIKDENGNEHLVAYYKRMKNLDNFYEMGLAIFNNETENFEQLVQFDLNTSLYPVGRPFRVTVEGQEYYYFAHLYPNNMFVRVKANMDQLTDPKSYEAFTCMVTGSKYSKSSPMLDRDRDGHLIYAWKANTAHIGYGREKEMISEGHMKPEESWFHLQDLYSGAAVEAFSGSVQWNSFRKRWVMIVQQNIGEVWYAEGDSPVGPWNYSSKIVSHQNYTFYLPTHHQYFDQDGGRLIYFEGTYTHSFSGNPDQTPRYDYNQIMYRLDLNDTRLYLPAPVYFISDVEGKSRYMMRSAVDSLDKWKNVNEIPFYAFPADRRLDGMIPVYLEKKNKNSRLKTEFQAIEGEAESPLFYGLPGLNTMEDQISGTWECKADDYPFAMNLLLREDKITGSVYSQIFEFKKGSILNDSLELFIRDSAEKITYLFTVQISDGELNGKYKGVENNFSGLVTGKRTDLIWKLNASPAVILLYEYQNEDGKYYYSTDSGLPKMKRSEKPVCRVWKNPSTTLTLDYKAKPVQLEK